MNDLSIEIPSFVQIHKKKRFRQTKKKTKSGDPQPHTNQMLTIREDAVFFLLLERKTLAQLMYLSYKHNVLLKQHIQPCASEVFFLKKLISKQPKSL